MSVPRWEGRSRPGKPREHQKAVCPRGVPFETSKSRLVVHKDEPTGSRPFLPGGDRSADGSRLSKRCVTCVSSAVVLRKRPPELRTLESRSVELRTDVLRKVAFAYPPASPRNTLAGVFERMRRAARTEKFARISGRLAPLVRSSGPEVEVSDVKV